MSEKERGYHLYHNPTNGQAPNILTLNIFGSWKFPWMWYDYEIRFFFGIKIIFKNRVKSMSAGL